MGVSFFFRGPSDNGILVGFSFWFSLLVSLYTSPKKGTTHTVDGRNSAPL